MKANKGNTPLHEDDMSEWLDHEIDCFPNRTTKAALYKHFIDLSKLAIREDRTRFIDILSQWLQLQSEPKTMLALHISQKYKLSELDKELKKFLPVATNSKLYQHLYRHRQENIGQKPLKAAKKITH